jgi:tetraacyldisaccharide 4'-kinase
MSLDTRLQRLWYGPAWRSAWLWPFEALFRLLVALRRAAFRFGVLRAVRVDIPVVVVGNVTVGGTGKTPVAAWLARQVALRGRKVAVVLRGYGGTHRGAPRVVSAGDDARVVGDEALVHAGKGVHAVIIGADRVAAAELAREQGAEIVICDDGLQHYRLERDVEIAVVDGRRGVGNGHLLPAGPLREPHPRLDEVDAVVVTEREGAGTLQLRLHRPLLLTAHFAPGQAVNLLSGERRPLGAFVGAPALHAVAGIGHPQAFFDSLRRQGLTFVAHALADHAVLDPAAPPFPPDATVLMTEKDAVKYPGYAQPHWWSVELDVSLDRDAAARLLDLVLERTGLTGAGVPLG